MQYWANYPNGYMTQVASNYGDSYMRNLPQDFVIPDFRMAERPDLYIWDGMEVSPSVNPVYPDGSSGTASSQDVTSQMDSSSGKWRWPSLLEGGPLNPRSAPMAHTGHPSHPHPHSHPAHMYSPGPPPTSLQQDGRMHAHTPGGGLPGGVTSTTNVTPGATPSLVVPQPLKMPRPNKTYHCRMCDQEFVNKSNLHQHSKEVHRMQEKMHKCVKCFKSFPSSQQLTQHMLVHNNIRKYKCQYCDKAFKQLSHVQQHQRRHTGERPYKCTIEGCDKAFAQLSNLQQHQRNHDARRQQSDRKPYQCSICDRRFATEVSLNNHISKVHNPDSPTSLSPSAIAVSAASSPLAVSMATAAATATATSVSSPSFPMLPPEGMPASLLTSQMHMPLSLGPSNAASAVALEKALVREAITAALAHQGPACQTSSQLEQEAEKTPKRRMEELSKRDLNLLRFSRAGLYDFPTQVPPLHPSLYAGRQLPQ